MKGHETTPGGHAAGDENWARDYVLLTLRIGKAIEARTGDGWMLDYHGPPEWKALVDAEEPGTGGALLEAAHAAEETLPRQGFGASRGRYLGKHLRALRTVARRLGMRGPDRDRFVRRLLTEQVCPIRYVAGSCACSWRRRGRCPSPRWRDGERRVTGVESG